MKQPTQKTRRRFRKTTWLWIFGGFAIISGLLYWDQIALLYVVSTAALTILMIVVAFSNLEDDVACSDSAENDESITLPASRADVMKENASERRQRKKTS